MGIGDWTDTPRGRIDRVSKAGGPRRGQAEEDAAAKKESDNVRANMVETDREARTERDRLADIENGKEYAIKHRKEMLENEKYLVGDEKYAKGGFVKHGKESKGKTKGRYI